MPSAAGQYEVTRHHSPEYLMNLKQHFRSRDVSQLKDQLARLG
jgi:hypothetical protein